MLKNIIFIITVLLLTETTSGQGLLSISPNHANIQQTLTTNVTAMGFGFASITPPTINNSYLMFNGTQVFPNWVNVIDDDHYDANWTFNVGIPLGAYDLIFDPGTFPFSFPYTLPGAFTVTDTCMITVLPTTGTVCLGDSVKLSYTASTTYQWRLNGVNISGATQQNYYAKSSGAYTLVTTGGTCAGSPVPVTITINSLPAATLTPASTQQLCPGQSVVFNANTGAGLTYKWMKNGVLIAGSSAANLLVYDAGTYKVTVTNSNGCSFTSAGTLVKVSSLPVFTSTKQPGPNNGKDAYVESYDPNSNLGSSIELDAFRWTIGGVGFTARALFQFDLSNIPPGSPIISANLNLYYDSLTTNGNHTQYGANTSYIQKVIAPWDENLVTWNNQPGSISTDQVVIPTSTSGQQDYLNIDVSALVKNMVDSPASNNGFLLRLITEVQYRALLFCASEYPNPVRRPKLVVKYSGAVISASNGDSICIGDSTTLQTTSGTYNYQWKRNGNNVIGATGSTYTAKTSGNYTVKISNGAGCSVISPVKAISVQSLPPATITPGGPTIFCSGDSVQLKGNYGITFSYVWKKNNTTISGATSKNFTAKTPGNYKLKVTNTYGCTKLSAPVTVTVPCKEEDGEVDNKLFNVNAYPNPSTSDFYFIINNTSDKNTLVRIYDMTGRLIIEKLFSGSDEIKVVNIADPGIYKAMVIQESQIKLITLVKL